MLLPGDDNPPLDRRCNSNEAGGVLDEAQMAQAASLATTAAALEIALAIVDGVLWPARELRNRFEVLEPAGRTLLGVGRPLARRDQLRPVLSETLRLPRIVLRSLHLGRCRDAPHAVGRTPAK